MEDYIYILLGLVWIIYAAYRANQKKKAKQKAPHHEQTTEPETGSDVKSLLEEILTGEVSQPSRPSAYIDESLSAITGARMEYENADIKTDYKLDSIPVEEGERIFDEDDLTSSYAQLFNTEDSEHMIKREDIDFDLRKAIIYSEILNRPYA
jgi:hypothetical protein